MVKSNITLLRLWILFLADNKSPCVEVRHEQGKVNVDQDWREMSTKGVQVKCKMSQPLLCMAAHWGYVSVGETETVAVFCVLIRVVHDVGAVFLFFVS